MKIVDMVNILKTQGKFKTEPIMFESALYYFGAIAMNMANMTKPDGSIINYYSLILSSSGCVDEQTEFLTPKGWKRISEFDNDLVLQSDKDGNTKFVKPSRYINIQTEEEGYLLDGGRNSNLSMMLSKEHNVLEYRNENKKALLTKAEDLFETSKYRGSYIKTSFKSPDREGLLMSDEDIRLNVAFKADGTITNAKLGSGRIRLKHEYKKQALRELLKTTKYKETKPENDYSIFWIKPNDITKSYGDNWWKANNRQLKIIYEEAPKWDGGYSKKTGLPIFRTTVKETADFMHYVFTTQTDNYVSLTIKERHDKKPFHTEYIISETGQKYKSMTSKMLSKKRFNGRKYCFTVNSSIWVARRNGFIFLTGNSGKDYAFETVKKIFNLPEEIYLSERRKGFDENSKDTTSGSYFDEEIEKSRDAIPKSILLGLEGTKEGLFSICTAQSISNFGSLNLTHGEFGDIITKSADLLGGLKELYDGQMKAKIIKSANVSSISELPCNLMAYGSHAGIAHEARAELMSLVKSGMYRRTYIIDLPACKIERQSANINTLAVEIAIKEIIDKAAKDFMFNKTIKKTNLFKTESFVSNESDFALHKIFDDLLNESNKDIQNDIKRAEVGALNMIENLSHIISFLEGKSKVDEESVNDAYEFYKKCRETTIETFTINHPYMAMYKMLHERPNLSISEMAGIDNTIPTSANKIKDELAMLEEHCYINNKKLKVGTGRVTRYDIEELPGNDNKAIIVSINSENLDFSKKHLAIDFIPFEVPFFGDGSSIENLVASNEVQSFCTATFESSAKATNGHRKADNFIEGQNMMAFDIDEGMTLDEAIKKLNPYTYIIYTTKSHRVEKGGFICDRFRIMMPTKTTFYVDAEQHKELYNNVASLLDISVYDIQTRNVSRLWYTNPGATLYTNRAENIDISGCIPSTETEKVFSQKLELIDERYNEKSINGIFKWFFANTAKGNRNDHMFRLGKFIKDLGEDFERYMNDANAMSDDPLIEREMKNIIMSVNR